MTDSTADSTIHGLTQILKAGIDPASDEFPIWDATAAITKRVTVDNLPITAAQAGAAPADAHFLTTQAESGLSAEANLGALTTGLLKITVAASVATPSTAVAGTDHVSPKGITSSSSGPVGVTTANNRMTYVATAAVTYTLPTGDLSAFISTTVDPLQYTFVKTAAGTLTIDPGANNFIANGAASATMADSTAGETYATISLRLISSSGSVNTWVITGAHGTWTPSA